MLTVDPNIRQIIDGVKLQPQPLMFMRNAAFKLMPVPDHAVVSRKCPFQNVGNLACFRMLDRARVPPLLSLAHVCGIGGNLPLSPKGLRCDRSIDGMRSGVNRARLRTHDSLAEKPS